MKDARSIIKTFYIIRFKDRFGFVKLRIGAETEKHRDNVIQKWRAIYPEGEYSVEVQKQQRVIDPKKWESE